MTSSPIDWAAHISSWRESGTSIKNWCQDNAISYHQFQYWRKKLGQLRQSEKPGAFVALKLPSSPLLIECNGTYLHISSGFDPLLLRKVISVLGQR